ncbi:MAG: phosphatidate cytidylyltransferase [Xanthomonadaceae bacterium]|jgi:phosphatidate cytidylyltransferase|nr:phosphatidate cytidylyltransferase [Xanthomonadaceae bacterium]
MTRIRVLMALIMAPVAIAAILLLPTSWLSPLAAIVLLIGLWEWLKLAGVQDSLSRTVLLLLNLLLMVLLVWASRTEESGFSPVLFQITSLIGVGWWGISLIWLKLFKATANDGRLVRAAKLAAGTLAIVPAWCALCLLHSDNFSSAPTPGSHFNAHLWLLSALMIVWAADSGAYFAGRHFGKRKLAPIISPNKTVEGAIGGILAGIVIVLPFGWGLGIPSAQWPILMLVALITVLASIVGDLFESLLKRHADAKDSGALIPGHGGMLDRIDSLLAALPIFLLSKEISGL